MSAHAASTRYTPRPLPPEVLRLPLELSLLYKVKGGAGPALLPLLRPAAHAGVEEGVLCGDMAGGGSKFESAEGLDLNRGQ